MSLAASGPVSTSATDLDLFEQSIRDIISMIDKVLEYVQAVNSGANSKPDERVGRYLLDTLGATVEGLEKDRLESLFNSHLQVLSTIFFSLFSRLTNTKLNRTHLWFHISPISFVLRWKCHPD